VAVNAKTNRIYVTNEQSNTVSVINGVDHSVTHVPVAAYPTALAIDEKGNRIFVASILGDAMTIIIGSTNATQPVPMPAGSHPNRVAYNATQKRVYVTFQVGNALAIVNPGNRTFQTLPTFSYVMDMVVDKFRNKVYLAYQNHLGVMDGVTHVQTTHPHAGNVLFSLALNALTNVLYGGNLMSNDVTVFAGPPGAIPWTVFKGLALH
jgi:YVTN family beta-propeller protein